MRRSIELLNRLLFTELLMLENANPPTTENLPASQPASNPPDDTFADTLNRIWRIVGRLEAYAELRAMRAVRL